MKTQHHTYHRTLLIALVLVSALVLFLGAPAQAAPPDNDDFDNATVITALPYTIVQDTSEATRAPDDPNCAGTSATVWFAYTPAEEQILTANTFGSSYDTTLGVYYGTRGALNNVTCNDDSGTLQSAVAFTAQAGVTYYFRIGAYDSGSGDRSGGELHFSVARIVPAPNDDFDDAIRITALNFTTGLNVGLATTAGDDPDCYGFRSNVWFAFTPEEDVSVAAGTFGSNYDTTLCIYTGERGNLTPVAANDDSLFADQSYVAFEALAGETYYILASRWSTPHLTDYLGFTLQEVEPLPANDDFDNAAVADPLPFISPVNNSGLTIDEDDPWSCIEGERPTAWFSFTPEEDITVEALAIDGNIPWDDIEGPGPGPHAVQGLPGIIAVYTGERGDLTPVACRIERLRLEAQAGETYYFMVSNLLDSPYAKVLFILKEALPAAPNDDFDDATSIKTLIFTDDKYTGAATRGADDPSLPGCGPTVWYSYTPERSTWLNIDTAGSDYDTLLGLYTGQRGALTRLAANDDYGESLQARLVYFVEGGETYYLMVCSHLAEIPYNLHLRVAPILYSYFPLLNRPTINGD